MTISTTRLAARVDTSAAARFDRIWPAHGFISRSQALRWCVRHFCLSFDPRAKVAGIDKDVEFERLKMERDLMETKIKELLEDKSR